MTTNLPFQGWMPDPSQSGALRLRQGGMWTDMVMRRQAPWGPDHMLPPIAHDPLHAIAS